MESSTITADLSFADELADALPKDIPFKFHHISTPPTRCAPLYSPPPGGQPERTYCESHFLDVSITPPGSSKPLSILAIEILIYTTANLTTLFVSKADSTGYLPLLSLGKGHASPLRTIATTFISNLIRHRQRPGKRLVLSLFARAQDQYLYPGSAENDRKHVSTDRELIRWWCRVVDPILQSYAAETLPHDVAPNSDDSAATTAQGYLLVPGEESHAYFLPPSARSDPSLRRRWTHGHPLREIPSVPTAPPRCLVPHFPDDPKARFLDELDDKLPDAASSVNQQSPSKRGRGLWPSIRTLEQFWEAMAFRQECSSGRLVGFLWMVVTPVDVDDGSAVGESRSLVSSFGSNTTAPSQSSVFDVSIPLPSSQPACKPRKRKLTGPIIPRLPRIKKAAASLSTPSVPKQSPYYSWPLSARGSLLLDEKDYKRAVQMLLRLDFATVELAAQSSAKWVEETGILGGREAEWGFEVVGRKEAVTLAESSGRNGVNVLRPKRKADAMGGIEDGGGQSANVPGAGLVRKKPKT